MTKNALSPIASQMAEWFWEFGPERDSRYQLSPSGWLFKLYQVRERLDALRDNDQGKVAFGLWGPSQVGKSTLLSSYFDLGADEVGQNSPLQWHPEDPVRFEREGLRTDIVALNPYNLKSDASACITRFVLAQEVSEIRNPVKVCLASRGQILHSMALGFLSDWNRTQQDRLTDETLSELIAGARKKPKKMARAAYETAYETASLLDVLSRSRLQEDRYSGLSDRAYTRILESRLITGDEENARELQRRLYWADVPSLTQLHEKLSQMMRRIEDLKGGAAVEIYCSYDVAACLLDMASYVRAVGGTDMQGSRIDPDLAHERRLLGIKYKLSNDRLLLSFNDGRPLFEQIEEFALFQALVWELVVPVNAGRLNNRGREGADLSRLLAAADILDFPGVSNIGTGGDDRLDDQLVVRNGSHLLFSHFLKRGKTSAMVAATARTSSIDGFCLLFRTMGPIARPGMICEGIRTWWRFNTGEDLGNHNQDPLPVNIVLTFFAEFVNDVLNNPQISRFSLAFEKLRSLGKISSTEISRYFAVSFPKYEKLRWPPGTENRAAALVDEAIGRIMGDPETQAVFRDPEIIRRAIYETGVSALLENVTAQATALAGRGRVRKQLLSIQSSLQQLFDEAAPGDALEQARRKELVEKWDAEIQRQLNLSGHIDRAASARLSRGIRELLTILPSDLEPLPMNLTQAGRDPKEYLLSQFTRWREQDRPDCNAPALGLTDMGDVTRIISYFCDAVILDDAATWLQRNFGWINERSAARDSRRYMAVYLTARILFGGERQEQTKGGDPYARLHKLAESESKNNGADRNGCPHYISILEPFLSQLRKVASLTTTGRPPQPGDNELTAMHGALQSASN